jgi:Flp pilus assembly pilin Flp
MAQWLNNFWLEEDGQDLIEYSLLIALGAIACAALLGICSPAVSGIWTRTNSELGSANSVASGG